MQSPSNAHVPAGLHPMKWADVDLGVLRRNAAAFVAEMGGVAVMAMVKAQAYGHGGPPAAQALLDGGATWLGVALPAEALELRRAGIEAPILVVGWSHPDTHRPMVEAAIDITVSDPASVGAVTAAARQAGRPARVHLKVETGMNRQGIDPTAVPGVLGHVAAQQRQLQLTGVFTHLADADGADPAHAEMQYARFLATVAVAQQVAGEPFLVHAANSAAALRFPHMRHDLVRPGIALYGYSPPNCPALEVEPAMTVRALVTHVHTVPKGEYVGYGCTWRAERDTRVATVAAGYADGVHRAQSNRGAVVLRGVRCPIVGRVSMDQVSVDVSALDGVEPGEGVIMVGGNGPDRMGADEVAAVEDTISYEVLCAVSARVPRRFIPTPAGHEGS
ncbi:MAG TPA: alanine racemase [Candidatus Dormibacteraeota bacterium]|nr:alanine racemase [Candidatus Dormibacteraeota bacterium]